LNKVLFIDRVHPSLKQALTERGFECETDFHGSYEEVKSKIGSYYGVIIRSRLPLDRPMLESAKKLKFIGRSGSGLENIDLEAAQDLGITVHNSPEGNCNAVGEHALGMLLSLFNRLPKADREVRAGIWDREGNRGIELGGKTVGIIGFGFTGSAFAKKLSGFDCRILAYDKYKTDYAPEYVEETDLETLKSNSDVISIHLPLSDETKAYVNAEFIESCGKPFFLINTARGQHVVSGDLLDALATNKVLGACLDVLEFEKSSFALKKYHEMPEEFKGLAESDRVILTPHVAGWTRKSYRRLSEFLAEKILQTHTL
jgi:D-3-phosphoglycerate dehydrogenase